MSSCRLLLGETSLLLRAWQKYLFIHSDWWSGSHQVLTLVTGTWLTSLGLLPFLRSIVCFTSKKKNKVQGYCSPHPPPPHTHTQRSWGGPFARPSITRPPLSSSDSTPASAAALDFKVGWHEKLNHQNQNAFWYQGGKRNSPEGFWF